MADKGDAEGSDLHRYHLGPAIEPPLPSDFDKDFQRSMTFVVSGVDRFLRSVFADPTVVEYIRTTARPDTVADLRRAEDEAELGRWLPGLNGCQLRKLWHALERHNADSDSSTSPPDSQPIPDIVSQPSLTAQRPRMGSCLRIWPSRREQASFMVENSRFFAPNLLWIDLCGEPLDKRPTSWKMDYSEYLEELAKIYSLHPASVKDCLSPGELPKTEVIGGTTLCVMRYCVDRVLDADPDDAAAVSSKLVVIITTHPSARDVDVVITLHLHPLRQEAKSEAFEGYYGMQAPDFEENNPSITRDHLVNIFFDDVLDTYDNAIVQLRAQVDHYEGCLARQLQADVSMELYAVRRRVSVFKRLLQMTDASIQKYVKHVTRNCGHDPFAEDLRDTVKSLLFSIDDLSECTTEMINLNISFMEHRSNQLLYVLTILTVVFTPITFICGLYGMNFKYMPELRYEHGYFYCIGAMAFTIFTTLGCLKCHGFICVRRRELEPLLT